ncbi:glutathione binding-like protein [Chromobacterium violaceum]|uniref:glutathione binding-like protein n=1 Tax=Chromobacterium violaceum TaxID=536 RepID=UPI001C70B952|nr:glutathione binding-like protein [Chromobacterium violaceum]
MPEAARQIFRDKLFRRPDLLENKLKTENYLLGERFGVADAYLYAEQGWLPRFDILLAPWPALHAYFQHIDARPAVQAAYQAEDAAAPVL